MHWPRHATWLLGLLVLAGCGSGSSKTEWQSTDSTLDTAKEQCSESVAVQMQLRGYTRQPLPETPQYKYRDEIFSTCMRQRGYEPR
ncbi:MAG: hypothetical protein GC191_10990 [Azospirillum sp.]|nr:hypothetical protein [Azospirillum sp.]